MALGLPDDPRQQRRLLIGLVPLLALFGYWYALHGSYVEEHQAMTTRLENLEMRNTQARMRAPQSRQLEEQLVQFEQHIERLEQLVPRGEEVSRLLGQIIPPSVVLIVLADQIGVSVARFSPASTNQGTHYNRRTFEMVVHGTYHEIARFLTEIGSLPRIITPINLSVIPYTMQRSGSGRAEQVLEAAFVIETYVLPEPQPAAGQGGGTGA